MSDLSRDVEELFHLALARDEASRRDWVRSQVAWSEAVRESVEVLLRADRALETAPDAPTGSEQVGPYELLAALGRGAAGSVHLARRSTPPHRLVALKIMRSREPEILARFRSEAAALARLEHPGIATLYEFGELPDGRAWFAMALVPGSPITRHADDRSLGVVERVRLVAEACAAVRHAHDRGVLHRDLKPSNILVDDRSSPPRPVVIDLGLAKALDDRALDDSDRTRLGQVVGTPEYMAPEQALGRSPDVRMDVFGLGCVLGATLAGSPPRSREALSSVDLPLFAAIGRTRPVPPSTSDRTVRDPSISRTRWRDLDAVVLKSVAVDPDDRYRNVAELQDDLELWLAGSIPDAARPHPLRRAMSWTRRHRGWASVAVAAIVAGVVASVLVLRSAREAARERRDADELLSVVESMLVAADPWHVRGTRSPVVEEGVAQSEAMLRERGWGRSARVELLRARCMMVAGENDRSIETARKAIALNDGRDPALTAEAMIVEAYALEYTRTETDRAFALADEAVALARTVLDPDDRRMLEIELARGRLITRRSPPDGAEALGVALERARSAWGPDDPLTLRIEQARIRAIGFMGDPTRCKPLHEDLLERTRRTLGADHPTTLAVAGGLMNSLAYANDWSRTVAVYEEFGPLLEESVGPNASMRLGMMNTAGYALSCAGRYDEAIELLRECTRRYREVHDPIHPMATLAERNLVFALQASGRLEEAVARLEEQCALPVDARQPTRLEIDRQNLEAVQAQLAASRAGG